MMNQGEDIESLQDGRPDEQQAGEPPVRGSEGEPVREAVSARRPSRFERYVGQLLSGSWLTRAEVRRQYPYVLFMTVLMFLYIANGFRIQKLHRHHDRLSDQVKELRARSLTVSSLRMISTRQSEIMRELDERGIPLEESLSPPKVIDK